MSSIYEQIAQLPPEKRELLEMMLLEQGVDLSQVLIVPQSRENNTFPLSFSQQRLWFLDKLEPGSPLYNIPAVLRLKGNLNISALEQSFQEVIKRHEVLRTIFSEENGEAVQVVSETFSFQINQIDLNTIPKTERDQTLQRYAAEESVKPFQLSSGPLLRVSLLSFSDSDHALLVTMHHIVSDNWSTGIFVHEIMQLYSAFVQGQQPQLPPLAVQYADFAAWQRKWFKGKTMDDQIAYWKQALQGIPPVLELPLDKPRPAYQTYNGDFKTFTVTNETTEGLKNLSRHQDVTMFMTLLSAYYVLLHRHAGQDDICVGSPIANRNRKETEPMIGFFVNTLVLRGALHGNPTFNELLQRTKESTLGAYAHQDLPFETLVEELQPERDMSHSPLFQAMFVLNNAPMEKLELPGLELSVVEIENKTSKFDLILNVLEDENGLQCKIEYNTDLFEAATIERMSRHYQILLGNIVESPDQPIGRLSILDDSEKKQLRAWSEPERFYNESQSVVDMLIKQAQATPEAPALRVLDETLSYDALHTQSNRLANLLLQKGLKHGDKVGVFADRSAQVIVSFLAVLKAGGVYLPLDPSYPSERLEYMLEDSGAAFLLTLSHLKEILPGNQRQTIVLDELAESLTSVSADTPKISLAAEDTAYVIYTSGSTGQPKGVEISHEAIANHCVDMASYYQLTPDDNVLQFAALNFDASIEQILPPLISGATVCMRENEIWDSHQLSQKITEYDLTVINPPTAYWAQMAETWAEQPEMIPENRLRLVIVGGDVLQPQALQNWYKTPLKHIRLINAYGPTEAVITATTYEVPEGFNGYRVPIGRPRANRRMYVVDPYGNPAPINVPGELLIGGNALAKGYLGRPELTEEKFIPNLFANGERMYKTGDRVRFLPDGSLDFMGRIDFQVKIRGFRIELGEIENAIQNIPDIRRAVVKAFDTPQGIKALAAYVTTVDNIKIDSSSIRSFLEEYLPDYMIPALFIQLEEMPLDPSGKINRRLLPEADLSKIEVKTEYVAPRTPTEEKLCDMMKEVLQVERVGIKDSFFDLGGHSMMATQVVSRIREAFDVELSLRVLFENPTAEGIARALIEAESEMQDEESLDAMLSEIENLSDEDIEKFLNEDEI